MGHWQPNQIHKALQKWSRILPGSSKLRPYNNIPLPSFCPHSFILKYPLVRPNWTISHLPCFPHEQIPLETLLILTASSSFVWEKAESKPTYICLATETGGKSYAISCLVCQLQGPHFLGCSCLSQGKLLTVTVINITGPVIHHRCSCMFRKNNCVLSENSLSQNRPKYEKFSNRESRP